VTAHCRYVVVLLMVVLVASATIGVARADVEIALSSEDGILYVDARATGLFGVSLAESLRSGLPARVRVDLLLFEEKVALFDREVLRDSWTVSVLFDLIEEEYSVLDAAGEVLMDGADLADVEEFVCAVDLWPLCDLEAVELDRNHYLGVEFRVEPLSIEEVRDLERWLRGNVRQGARLRDVPGRLVGMLRSQLGLGDSVERGRSAGFRPGELPPPD